jgi:hypothetical protein
MKTFVKSHPVPHLHQSVHGLASGRAFGGREHAAAKFAGGLALPGRGGRRDCFWYEGTCARASEMGTDAVEDERARQAVEAGGGVGNGGRRD